MPGCDPQSTSPFLDARVERAAGMHCQATSRHWLQRTLLLFTTTTRQAACSSSLGVVLNLVQGLKGWLPAENRNRLQGDGMARINVGRDPGMQGRPTYEAGLEQRTLMEHVTRCLLVDLLHQLD
jgi:hypothetical protein